MIYLGKEPPPEKPSCEHLLQTLFTEKLSIDEKMCILQKDYGFSHTKEENDMVNITKMLINIERDLAKKEGRAEGEAKECQKWILELLKRGMTKEEVMEIGKISRNELEAIISG